MVLVGCLVVGTLATPLAAATPVSGRFTDDDGHPGEVYLEWLATIGAVQGCDPPAYTRICPDRTLNRAEAAKILMDAGRSTGFLPPIPPSLLDRVISGCDPPTNRQLCPTESLTRGQAAKVLVGIFDLTAPPSFESPWTDTVGRSYQEAARIAAYHGLWDSSLGRFTGGETIDQAELARAVVLAATGDDPCPANPFTAARVDSLRRRFPSQTFTAYAYDTRTGCAYWMHPDNRLRTASVFKVMVMAGALLEAQEDGRAVSSSEWSQLVPMITESANNPVRALWRHFGGSPWFGRQAEIFGMSETTPVGDKGRVWGRTTTSAKDQADLLRQVLRGKWGATRGALPVESMGVDDLGGLRTDLGGDPGGSLGLDRGAEERVCRAHRKLGWVRPATGWRGGIHDRGPQQRLVDLDQGGGSGRRDLGLGRRVLGSLTAATVGSQCPWPDA